MVTLVKEWGWSCDESGTVSGRVYRTEIGTFRCPWERPAGDWGTRRQAVSLAIWLYQACMYTIGLAAATATAGVLAVSAVATGTATPARTDPAKPSVNRGEMMARLMRMIPPWHIYRSAAFTWRQRPADASSVMFFICQRWALTCTTINRYAGHINKKNRHDILRFRCI